MLKVLFNERATQSVFRGTLDVRGRDALICWQGTYPSGSQGQCIAAVMTRFTMQALAMLATQPTPPKVITLDVRELDYQWGNNLLEAFLPLSYAPAETRVLYALEQHRALQVFMHELDVPFMTSLQ